jgi:hypothetical protein
MGGGPSYSVESRSFRATSEGYFTKSTQEVFKQKRLHPKMDPAQAWLRESRDSENHPNSLAIVIALDVTGSMGHIPHELCKDGLPTVIGTIMQAGVEHPQVLFLAIGDHECDTSPLQVGQFETSDDLMDFWLTNVYLEGGGGPNGGESYSLAHYFVGHHTSIDCFEKRKQKGFLFTIGDEPNLLNYPESMFKHLMEKGQHRKYTAKELVEKAMETYFVYHIHLASSRSDSSGRIAENWKALLGQNYIVLNDQNDIPKTIAKLIMQNYDNQIRETINTSISSSSKSADTEEPVKDSMTLL